LPKRQPAVTPKKAQPPVAEQPPPQTTPETAAAND
jgi:hypothetical protein